MFAARQLVRNRWTQGLLDDGQVTFDRALAMLRLVDAGADHSTVETCSGLDLVGVDRLAAARRQMSRCDERQVLMDRCVSIQPTLDELSWRRSGQLPAVDGRVVERALCSRADELQLLPGGESCARGPR